MGRHGAVSRSFGREYAHASGCGPDRRYELRSGPEHLCHSRDTGLAGALSRAGAAGGFTRADRLVGDCHCGGDVCGGVCCGQDSSV